MNLVRLMQQGEVTCEDVVFFEDMFQPGIESLPYIMDQIPETMRPQVWVRCLAQAIDPDDFVHVWGMAPWMSTYEKMVNHFVTGVLATNEEMVAHMRIAGWTAPIYNISGLSFGKQEVLSRIGFEQNLKPFNERTMRVGFAARFDQEKQPGFDMDLIEEWHRRNLKPVEFAIFQGNMLRSNNNDYVIRARKMQADSKLNVYEDLSKNHYYDLLTLFVLLCFHLNCFLVNLIWILRLSLKSNYLNNRLMFFFDYLNILIHSLRLLYYYLHLY
jgi:hypothetical protein